VRREGTAMRIAKANLGDFSFQIDIDPDEPKEIQLYFYFEWMTTESKPRKIFKENGGRIYTMDAEELRNALTKAIKAIRKARKKEATP
jgi:hypothetical protein